MYRLTPHMLQHFRRSLRQYHRLFSAGRCSGWQLEELIYRAIQSDNAAQHHAQWTERGHDDKADIRVTDRDRRYDLQIKSGEIKRGMLVLSGHRLTRFNRDFSAITQYLAGARNEIVAVPYRRVDNEEGRKHIYRLAYVNRQLLTDLDTDAWKQKGKQWVQENRYGVRFSLHPSMSWQIWWRIPESQVQLTAEVSI